MPHAVLVNPPAPHRRRIIRNIDCAIESKGYYLPHPYDLLGLSGAFGAHWALFFEDATAQGWSSDQTLSRLERRRPDLVVTAISDVCYRQDLRFLIRLRQALPDTRILALGNALLEEPSSRETLEHCDGIIDSPWDFDPEARGDAGPAAGLRSPASGYPAPRKTVRRLARTMPRYELFNSARYRWPFARHFRFMTVMTAWGCPYRCSYCTDAALPFLAGDARAFGEELARIAALGIRELYVADKSFGLPADNAEAFLDALCVSPRGFSWSVYLHPLQAKARFLARMKAAGCHTIITGVESAAFETLRSWGRPVRKEHVTALVADAHQAGIEVCGDFILGLPGESEADLESSVRLAVDLDLDFASFNIAAPFPGTAIRRQAVAQGRMHEQDHQFDSLAREAVLGSDQVSGERLRHWRRRAYRCFYGRPKYLWRRLKALKTWQQFVIQVQEAAMVWVKSRG